MIATLFGILAFFFGACVGSFLNVVVYRLNLPHLRGGFRLAHLGGVVKGRSFCPKCKKKIPWHDNLPLLSFFLLRGRCRSCHSPISWQYPLVELAAGLATVFVFFHLRGEPQAQHHLGGVVYYLLITYALITLFVSDLRYQTIPDEIVYPAMGLAALPHLGGVVKWPWLSTTPEVFFLSSLGAAVFFWLLALITRGKGMGMGDVKLAGLMGLVLGSPKVIVALMLAFLTGALTGVILVLVGKKHFGEQIPFGPFLTAATWVSLFWGQTIWQFYLGKLLL